MPPSRPHTLPYPKPHLTHTAGLPLLSPTCMPMCARKRPMPAEVASRTERGISFTSAVRMPTRVTRMKMKPAGQPVGQGEAKEGGGGRRLVGAEQGCHQAGRRGSGSCRAGMGRGCGGARTLNEHSGQRHVKGHAAGTHEAHHSVGAAGAGGAVKRLEGAGCIPRGRLGRNTRQGWRQQQACAAQGAHK